MKTLLPNTTIMIPIAIWRMRRIWKHRSSHHPFLEVIHLILSVSSPTKKIVQSQTVMIPRKMALRTRYGIYSLLGPTFHFSFSHPGLNSSEDHAPAYYKEKMKEGRVIKVQDVAFITYADHIQCHSLTDQYPLSFQAFLFYLYTDHIEFAPFGSEANRKTRASEIVPLAPDHVPRPSPKSIYRLADKVYSLASHRTAFPPHRGYVV